MAFILLDPVINILKNCKDCGMEKSQITIYQPAFGTTGKPDRRFIDKS